MTRRLLLETKTGVRLTWEELAKLEEEEEEHGDITVAGGKLVFPPSNTAETPSSSHLAHMDRLRARQAEREYQRMMHGNRKEFTSFSPEHTGVGASGFQHSVMGLNMALGVGCAYVAAEYLGRQFGLSPTNQTLVSLCSMIGMLLMEMTLFIIRAGKFDQMDQRYRDSQKKRL